MLYTPLIRRSLAGVANNTERVLGRQAGVLQYVLRRGVSEALLIAVQSLLTH